MICKKCGKEIDENLISCNNCGDEIIKKESNTFGWGLLGFLIPIIGLILFFVWKNNKPKAAKSAGIGALIGVVINLISTFIFISLHM